MGDHCRGRRRVVIDQLEFVLLSNIKVISNLFLNVSDRIGLWKHVLNLKVFRISFQSHRFYSIDIEKTFLLHSSMILTYHFNTTRAVVPCAMTQTDITRRRYTKGPRCSLTFFFLSWQRQSVKVISFSLWNLCGPFSLKSWFLKWVIVRSLSLVHSDSIRLWRDFWWRDWRNMNDSDEIRKLRSGRAVASLNMIAERETYYW